MKVSTDLALLSNIIRSTDDAIISKNLDSIVTSWNPAAERLFGYAAHEIIGQSITLIIPNEFIHEEKEIIQKILKGESIDHYETQRKRKDGKRIDLSISVSPIRNDHGKIIGASKIARDITERKANAKRLLESERFNRALLDSLDLHIAVVNPAGHILNTNQAWNNFAHSNGVTSLSRVGVGGNYFESCANAVAAGDGIAEQALQGIQSVLTRETEIFELEYPCDSPTERRWFLLRALAFQEGNVITMHQNITQRKLAELQIKKNEERFSSIVAHGNDIIALLDRNLKVIYRSPSVERIFGLDIATGELNQPQATRMELVHPDDKDRYLETLKRSIDNPGQSFNVSFKSEHGSGRFVEIEGVATNYLNDESIGAIVLNLRDVSERNSLERQLIRNELQMRLLIKHTPAAVAMFDSEMKYIIASERWMVDYQLGDQNIIGKSHYEIFPEISAEWKALHQRTLQGEGLFKEEDPFVRADGTTDWVRWEMQPWYTENHSIGGMILFTEVITERKVAEEKIHQLHDEIAKSERKFRALVEHSDSVINVLDENFNPIYRSPNGHKLTGYTNSDRIEGGTFSWIHPEDLKSVEEFFIGRLSAPGVPASIITRLKHKDGQYRWMEITATNLLHDDSVKGIVINARNINELKNAVEEVKLLNDELSKNELRFRSLVENNEALIILVDENFKALYRSPSSERVSGFSDEELAIENGMLKIHPDDLSNFVASFNESKANPGKTIYVGDFRFKHKKGHYFWLAASFKNFLNDRSVGAIVLNAIDITVKKEAEIVLERINADLESKVKERTEQLDKVNKELEAFSYSVSHDLRTPLRAINGYAKMLEEDYTSVFDENGKRLLKTVQYNAHQMGKLIDDLLAFSRLGKNELHKTVVNMYDLVTKVVDEVCVLYPNAAVQIHSLQNALGDANLLKQVWVNYISNALKYSSKNKQPQVELSSTAGEQEIIYTVHDNGIGFDPAYANKLFKVFQRLHSQEDFEGTGVGLAMVEKIITKHGGRVWAESNLGKGATFNFSLPVDKIMK